jgi:hypothetical protein
MATRKRIIRFALEGWLMLRDNARMRAVAVAALLLCAGCATGPLPSYERRALAAPELKAVREQVRGYAKTHCGTCHTASLPTAVPGALKIYNLDAEQWSSTLTSGQLRNGFPRRLTGRLDDDGKRQLRAFIEAELALRE